MSQDRINPLLESFPPTEIRLTVSAEQRIIEVNDSACIFLDESVEKLLNQDFLSLMPEPACQILKDVCRGLKPSTNNAIWRQIVGIEDPPDYQILWSIKAEFSTQGEITRIFYSGKPYRLPHSNRIDHFYPTEIIDHTLESILITDPAGTIQSANLSCVQLTGYGLDELIGLNLFQFLQPNASPSWSEGIQSILGQLGLWEGNLILLPKSSPAFLAKVRLVQPDILSSSPKGITAYFAEQSRLGDQLESLTGEKYLASDLFQRSVIHHRVQHAIQLAKRNLKQVGFLYFTIDQVDQITSQFGRISTDRMMQEILVRLQHELRTSDTITQLDQNGFLIVIENLERSSADGAIIVSNKILDLISRPINIQNNLMTLSGKIGVSIFPNNGIDADSLIQKARQACLRIPFHSTRPVQFFGQDTRVNFDQPLAVYSRLRPALENKEFLLEYQPIIESVKHRIIYLEALLRWDNPDLGLLMPEDFLPALESTGLIQKLTEWIIKTACQQMVSLAQTDSIPVGIVINLSKKQLEYPELGRIIATSILSASLPPHRLTVEISEILLMEKLEETRRLIYELRKLGIRISIDDFGKGYSSLNILKSLGLHSLKIDRSYAHNIVNDQSTLSQVQGLISIGQHLNVEIIAEGIETPDEAAIFAANGCHSYQGYYFAPPLRLAELRGKLNQTLPWTI